MSSPVGTFRIRASRVVSIYDSAGDALTWQGSTCCESVVVREHLGVSGRECVVSVSVCFFALVACFWTVSGDESYIHGERLAGCILEKGGGGSRGVGGRFRLGDQLRDYGGQVSDCRRSRRVQRLSLEKDALSFLHPRVVLHQLRVEERILRDDVLDPLDQAVCGESRVQKVALFSPPLGGHSQRWKTWTRGICFRPAYLRHYGPGAVQP